ncbi:MAG: sulfurtransferase [Anaerolineaceae bacterium]|nr:sulfurtransferase [Anaerolineaceae bacterium]
MKTYTTFIDPDELVNLLDDPNLIVIDCRFDLLNPAWGYQDYLKNHIPNAIYADLDKNLSRSITEETGRHPLPESDKFIETCSNWGIDKDKQVVVYDTTSGSFASRLWWMLKYFGHLNVAILDGGFSAWLDSGFSQESGSGHKRPSKFKGTPDHNLLKTTTEMETLILQPDCTVIDARSRERYLGLQEPLDKIAGHIPNAINFFHQNNLDPNGKLLSIEELQEKYNDLLEGKNDNSKVLYCGSGVTSCLNFAVMQHIDIKPLYLYLGSWSEWIRNPNHPIISENIS